VDGNSTLQFFFSQDRWLSEHGDPGVVAAGSKEICRAKMKLDVMRKGEVVSISVEGKLDTCGSVSLVHSSFMRDIAPCQRYGLKAVKLSGIGGISEPLRQAGVLYVQAPGEEHKKVLCYLFDKQMGNTKEILLFSLRIIREAKVDIIHHMDQSLRGVATKLRFLEDTSQLPKKKEIFGDKLRATKSFLRNQAMKLRKAAITPMQLLVQMGALQKYNKGQCDEVRESYLLELARMSGRF
jgi:hypothetical protein